MLLALKYRWTAWHMSPLILILTISSISISVNNSNFTSVFYKADSYANPGAERNFTESKW